MPERTVLMTDTEVKVTDKKGDRRRCRYDRCKDKTFQEETEHRNVLDEDDPHTRGVGTDTEVTHLHL